LLVGALGNNLIAGPGRAQELTPHTHGSNRKRGQGPYAAGNAESHPLRPRLWLL
jgi:hypothetical protein